MDCHGELIFRCLASHQIREQPGPVLLISMLDQIQELPEEVF